MNHFQKFLSQFRFNMFLILLLDNLIVLINWYLAEEVLGLTGYELLFAVVIVSLFAMTILPWTTARYLTHPTQLIWQAILHIAPDTANTPAPDVKKLSLGRELVTSLVTHIYQLARVAESIDRAPQSKQSELKANFIANNLPLPLVVLDNNDTILFANDAMLKYLGQSESDVVNQNVYTVLDMAFTSEKTFDEWLNSAKQNKAVDSQTWERVRLRLPDGSEARLLDLAAYYNRSNPLGLETMLVFFDHTSQYSQDDQSVGFVALAVHELRTPLTLLRGYVEAFEEELAGKLNPEMTDFMHKMGAAAEQLTAFVNNILNVARIENDQLELKLHEERWPEIVQTAVSDMALRARVRGITLETEIAPDLPAVGADRVSISEVIMNLLDNAIKYSGDSKKVVVKSYLNADGLVETVVVDGGVGVPTSAVEHLFDKFYRDYHNRSQVGGTGLGLYLSKAIVNAHGGQIWVKANEGQGSTFGFSLLPYSQLADEHKTGDNQDIVRNAHGWIKNHSLYRR